MPNAAAALVLEHFDASTTLLPLTLTAEIAYRFVPEDILIDLYAEDYIKRHDLRSLSRSLSREHLGIDLDQASPRELLLLMAKAETLLSKIAGSLSAEAHE